MFGREFANHTDVLVQSLGEMNHEYEKKIVRQKKNSIIDQAKKMYIALFGIPEIGFQIRGLYFNHIVLPFMETKKANKILDAGSGIGAYTFALAKTFPNASVIGGEIDKKKLKSCLSMKKQLHQSNVTFIELDLTKKNFKEKFDLIVIIDVLEHIENYKGVLKNLYSLLNKGGYLYVHVPQPNQKRIFTSLKKWHHEDHVHEGIKKTILQSDLKTIGFRVLKAKETFGFFGKLVWEINHLLLLKSFILAGLVFPILYPIALLDKMVNNKQGLGVAVLAQK